MKNIFKLFQFSYNSKTIFKIFLLLCIFSITSYNASAQNIKVLFPNGAERIPPGADTVIQWLPANIPVFVEFSKDNAKTWDTIGRNVVGGSFRHTFPNSLFDSCFIRVSDARPIDQRPLWRFQEVVQNSCRPNLGIPQNVYLSASSDIQRRFALDSNDVDFFGSRIGTASRNAFCFDGDVRKISVSHSGLYFSNISYNSFRVYVSSSGQPFQSSTLASTDTNRLSCLDIHPNEQEAIIGDIHGGVRIVRLNQDIKTSQRIGVFGIDDSISSVKYDDAGNFLIVGTKDRYALVKNNILQPPRYISAGEVLRTGDFHPKGNLIVLLKKSGHAELIDYSQNSAIPLDSAGYRYSSVHFSHSGNYLVMALDSVGTNGGIVAVFEPRTGKLLGLLSDTLHKSKILDAALSPDDNDLLTCGRFEAPNSNLESILWVKNPSSDVSDAHFLIAQQALQPIVLDFGEILRGTRRDSIFSDAVCNKLGSNLRVDSVRFEGGLPSVFRINSSIPDVLLKDECRSYSFSFTPPTSGKFSSTVRYYTRLGYFSAQVRGSAVECAAPIRPLEIHPVISVSEVVPGEKFTMTLQCTDTIPRILGEQSNYSIQIRTDASTVFPLSPASASYIDGKSRVLVYKGVLPVQNTQEKIIFSTDFICTLGITDSLSFTIDSVSILPVCTSSLAKNSSQIRVSICKAGGKELIDAAQPSLFTIKRNVIRSNEDIEVLATYRESAEAQWRIVNSLGKIVAEKSVFGSYGTIIHERFSTEGFAPGIYFISFENGITRSILQCSVVP